jgi:hypothetical protein
MLTNGVGGGDGGDDVLDHSLGQLVRHTLQKVRKTAAAGQAGEA